jgi:hypothetical protein
MLIQTRFPFQAIRYLQETRRFYCDSGWKIRLKPTYVVYLPGFPEIFDGGTRLQLSSLAD